MNRLPCRKAALWLVALFILSGSQARAQSVAIVVDDGTMPRAAQHGLDKLEAALRTRGLTVMRGRQAVAASALVVVAGLRNANGPAAQALSSLNGSVPTVAEALTIRRGVPFAGKSALLLVGSDSVGLMYAALDIADAVRWSANRANPFELVRDTSEQPFIKTRAVSMYTMNRAYFESRFYDERFWTRYFDMFAANRFNQFVLIPGYENSGFLAPLYPYLFDVPGFSQVKMLGLSHDEQARNLATLKNVIRLAHDRGIKFELGLWSHIDRPAPGELDSADPGQQEIARARFASQQIPGFVPRIEGVTYENVLAYTKAALVRLRELLPDVDSLGFREHNESGLRDEMVPSFWHEIFAVLKGVNKPIDLRAKGVSRDLFADAVHQGLDTTVNTKVWMEQLGLPFHPTHINKGNQFDQRHGYADLLQYPQFYKMTWNVWTGGTTRLLLWGDPDYVRRFAGAARLYDSDSVEINESGATKMHGDAHDATPIPILTPSYRTYDYEFERYWQYYRVWGRNLYSPDTSRDVFDREFVERFGPQAAPHVSRALTAASRVLPRIVAGSYLYVHFPTTNGWPEMQRQGNLPTYAAREEGSDIQQFMNVHDAATSLVNGTDTAMRRPEETSYWFASTSATILAELAEAEKSLGTRRSPEFLATAADLKILAGLARYHSSRLLAGVEYNLYKMTGSLESFDAAIGHERQAIAAWSDAVAAAGDVYTATMTFGPHVKGFPRHWSEELQLLRRDFDALLAERQTAKATAGVSTVHIRSWNPSVRSPQATVARASLATPGRDLSVTATVSAPAGVKWVRLRYRHVNQKEDYQSIDMKPQSPGQYVAAIPGAFITPMFDLMYFVEVVDNAGSGRMFPDLEQETPYVIVSVAR